MKDNNCTKICSFEHFLIRTSKIRLSPDEITDDILAKANLTRSKYYKSCYRKFEINFKTIMTRSRLISNLVNCNDIHLICHHQG